MDVYELMEEIINIVSEGRKEGESDTDFKNRTHKELVIAIDKKAQAAREKGDTEEWKKQHAKLAKLDDIQPVANAYTRAENDPPEDTKKAEMAVHKSVRRNSENAAKTHSHNARQLEKRSIKAGEAGREGAAERLYNQANAEWDAETRAQQKAAEAHKKVEELRYGKSDEALELAESIIAQAQNLFELDYEEKQNISPNKISKVTKNDKGEKVEVVSVADELFPYEGDAKQQYNQKILAKINDMIEGTGSLEDLIQFVRAGAKVKKPAHEGYEKAIEILEDVMMFGDWAKENDKKEKTAEEIAESITSLLNSFYVTEEKNIFGKETGVGSLENDVAKTVTGKTLNQHIENAVAKLTTPKKK